MGDNLFLYARGIFLVELAIVPHKWLGRVEDDAAARQRSNFAMTRPDKGLSSAIATMRCSISSGTQFFRFGFRRDDSMIASNPPSSTAAL